MIVFPFTGGLFNNQSEDVNKMENGAFSISVPKLRNNIPDKVKNSLTLGSFKRGLRMYLISKYYKHLVIIRAFSSTTGTGTIQLTIIIIIIIII